MNHKKQPRGIRNNNPGNIRHGDNWQGMTDIQTDPAFVQFVTPEYGIRAMTRIFKSYARRGLVTVEQIVSTWAPDNENDTESYVKHVASVLGLSPDTPVAEHDYPALIAVIIKHENGSQPYSRDTIEAGVMLA
ncbi:structural protein [Kistimonas asteriae]|uniref:structural protein n=1 Tax=Kistimonas asteriae TaxID=517724 RepID=UPI001FE79A35|nr:structural protein [Kistimonas asteriae]